MPNSDTDIFDDLNSQSDSEEPKLQPKEKLPKKVFKEKKTEEELNLQKLLFGDKETLIENLKNQTEKERKRKDDSSDEDTSKKKRRQAVWYDSDDDDKVQVGDVLKQTRRTGPLDHLDKSKSYKSFLTRKFERVVTTPKWADLDKEEEELDSDEEILKTVGHLDTPDRKNLSSGLLQFKTLKDLNRETYCEGPITDIHFHPTSTVSLVCGMKGFATVYSIDGRKNDKLHSIHFKNFPVTCSRLLSNGKDVIFGSKVKYFYTYDLVESKETRVFLPTTMTKLKKFEISPDNKYIAAVGRFGLIHLLDMNTKELIHTFKSENLCKSIKFSSDSKRIFANSTKNDVTIFSIKQERAEHIFYDDGCIAGTCLAISPNNDLFCTASGEGVVNVYNYNDVFKNSLPVPEKIIKNLRTRIVDIKFNHTGELLGICSNKVQNAVRLVHFPSSEVFKNFPKLDNNKLGDVRCMSFSPGSGFFALGSYEGKVPLFRLKHYKNY